MSDFHGRVATLEQELTKLGFSRRVGSTRIAWRGRWSGRDCIVSVARERRTRYAGEVRLWEDLGFRLRAELATTIRTQLYFVREGFARSALVRWIYKLRRLIVIDRVPDDLRGFVGVTIDRDWAERFVTESGTTDEVRTLLTEGATTALAGSVYIAPTSESGRVYYASPIIDLETLSADRSRVVLDRLERIGTAAERLPPPTVVREVGAFGRFSENYPWAIAVGGLLGCMALLAFAAFLFVAIAFLLRTVRH